MRTADFQAFNDGFDYACERILELNARGHFHQVGATMAISGFRYDHWWREGTEAALQWALRNGSLPPKQIYR